MFGSLIEQCRNEAPREFDIPWGEMFGARPKHCINVRDSAVSQYPQCSKDLNVWLPEAGCSAADLCDLVRSLGGDMVEQVSLVDEFRHPRTGRTSHCYRVTYRHTERTLTRAEVNQLHQRIGRAAAERLAVQVW